MPFLDHSLVAHKGSRLKYHPVLVVFPILYHFLSLYWWSLKVFNKLLTIEPLSYVLPLDNAKLKSQR